MQQALAADLAAIVDRLSKIPSFVVNTIDPKNGTKLIPWYTVEGSIVRDLIVNDASLATQVRSVPAQIVHWGRITAGAKRVWEIEEREYRRWRDGKQLEFSQPPKGEEDSKWKKPTEATIDAMIRTSNGYAEMQIRIEIAEEAYNACNGVLEGFRAQVQMLKTFVSRAAEANMVV